MPDGILGFPRPGADPILAYTVTIKLDNSITSLEFSNVVSEFELKAGNKGRVVDIEPNQRLVEMGFEFGTAGINSEPPVAFKNDLESIPHRLNLTAEEETGKELEPPKTIDFVLDAVSEGVFGGSRPFADSTLEYTVFVRDEIVESTVIIMGNTLPNTREIDDIEMADIADGHKITIQLDDNRATKERKRRIDNGLKELLSMDKSEKFSNYSWRAV